MAKQEIYRGTTEQVCYQRSCGKEEQYDRLGRGKSGGTRKSLQDQVDQGSASVKDTPWTGKLDLTFCLSSTYDQLLLRDAAHLHGNDTSWRRVDTNSDEGISWLRNIKISIYRL